MDSLQTPGWQWHWHLHSVCSWQLQVLSGCSRTPKLWFLLSWNIISKIIPACFEVKRRWQTHILYCFLFERLYGMCSVCLLDIFYNLTRLHYIRRHLTPSYHWITVIRCQSLDIYISYCYQHCWINTSNHGISIDIL